MSNVNNYAMAKQMDQFKLKVLDPQIERTAKAEEIMKDEKHVWANEDQKKIARAQYDSYRAWLAFFQLHYDEGMKLVKQHETLVDKMSKMYDSWYQNISNEGKQETELMSSQADILCEIMGELYKELAPLNLPGMKQPSPLNMK
jgi:hypothetical protein